MSAKDRLRIVGSDDAVPAENLYGDALVKAAQACAATNPTTVFLAWETADGDVKLRTFPNSEGMRRGILHRLVDMVFVGAADE